MTDRADRMVPAPPVDGRSDTQAHTAALEAFVAFIEVSDSEFEVHELAGRAV